jgi:hypothetical protein
MHDTSAFFQEATLKICGSLNIEDSLQESIRFLRKYIPVDEGQMGTLCCQLYYFVSYEHKRALIPRQGFLISTPITPSRLNVYPVKPSSV